jgi:hypothetical protein
MKVSLGDIMHLDKQIHYRACARKGICQNPPLASGRERYQEGTVRYSPIISQLIRRGKPDGECSMSETAGMQRFIKFLTTRRYGDENSRTRMKAKLPDR